MFERFTERARRVIILAQEEAKRLNHSAVGTEHILLGIIREGEGVASKVLESLNISPERVRAEIEGAIGRGERAPHEEVAFTPRAKKVLELALDEARRLGHNYIGTEHLLLGLIREGEGVAALVLEATGADLDRVRAQVVYLLGEEGTTPWQPERGIRTPTDAALAFGLLELTHAVTNSADLSPDRKEAILEHVSYLGGQVIQASGGRQRSLITSVVEGLERLLAGVAGLPPPWQALKPLLESVARIGSPEPVKAPSALPHQMLDGLTRRLRRRTFRKGTKIFQEGQADYALYIIESGRVGVFLSTEGSADVAVDLGSGEVFGEMALLDVRSRLTSAEALEDTTVHTLEMEDFQRYLQASPALAFALMRYLNAVLRRRMDNAQT